MKWIVTRGLAALVLGAGPAAAQSFNASIEYLEVKAGGAVILRPWFAAKPGDRLTLITTQGRAGSFTVTAGAVKEQPGHCYAKNVHEISVKSAALGKGIKPVEYGRNRQPSWPLAILISPAAPKAKKLARDQATSGGLPPGQVANNVTQAIDVDGDGKADLLVIKTCSGYDAKKKVSQATLDRQNHRQCVHKGPVFRHLWLRRGDGWKQIWYEDLC